MYMCCTKCVITLCFFKNIHDKGTLKSSGQNWMRFQNTNHKTFHCVTLRNPFTCTFAVIRARIRAWWTQLNFASCKIRNGSWQNILQSQFALLAIVNDNSSLFIFRTVNTDLQWVIGLHQWIFIRHPLGKI